MVLMIFNTLGRRMEKFVPLREGEVYMYVCGPTVYDHIHIGNARAFVVADIVRRYLEYKGYKVTFVSNITDVDDKSIKRAQEMGISLQQLGEIYSDSYFEDLEKLNIKKADVNPRATQHIIEIIELIQKLIDKGYAYEVDGEVYYDISKFEDYGKLSGNKAEALELGSRIEINPKKRNPADFALWKRWKKGEPAWYSPWGKGRPGWHIECSAMAMRYLGESFDIHMGGKDLIFPHHENEIAQSEAATGKIFAKYWLHNEWLTVDGKKMSKSLGNFVTVRDALKRYNPEILRLFVASAHYRSPIDFNDESLKQAERNLQRLLNTIETFEAIGEKDEQTLDEDTLLMEVEKMQKRFEEAMDNDFNTPLALSILLELARTINIYTESHKEIETKTKRKVLDILTRLLDVFGIKVERRVAGSQDIVDKLMALIMKIRERARERRDWETSDMMREELETIGFMVEDTPEGTKWKMKKTF